MAAKNGYFPDNCFCPGQCKFCYERDFTKVFPGIRTQCIPVYTKEAFDFFCKKLFDYRKINKEKIDLKIRGNCLQKTKDGFQYFPACDFFNLGLTQSQIEKVVQIQNEFYTTGLNADFKLIKALSEKYPNKFRLHLSIITFDPSIRRNIMNPDINMDNLKKICKVAIRPVYFLVYFNKKQIASDIGILNKFSQKNKGSFYIHKLYYNKFSPDCIKDYATKGEDNFKSIIYYLKFNDKKLGNISKRLYFAPSSKIYAWKSQNDIEQLLKVCKGSDSEAIFCSIGAYQLIRSLRKKMHVIAIENSMGGCVDFTIGITVKSIIHKISEMSADGIVLRYIYIPKSMFVFKDKFDLNGDTVGLIKEEFPGIKIKVIDIPLRVHASLSLDTCFRYYILEESNRLNIFQG